MLPKRFQGGLTVIEILAVLAILAILLTLVLGTFGKFNNFHALDKDMEVVLNLLNEARSKTLSSENDTQYGVHIASTTAVLYTGASYSSSASTNKTVPFSGRSTVTLSLSGGSDILFQRLTGDTSATGTITFTLFDASQSKTITVYSTGLAESN